MIRRLLTIFASLRIPMLLFALPYSMLWMRTSESAGWLMVINHAALVLFGFAGVDASLIRRGKEPRLTLRRGSDFFDIRVIEVSRAVLAIVALIAGFILLFIQWKLGAIALAALVFMELASDGLTTRWRRNRFAWCEWTLPLVLLIAPAMAIAASAKSRLADLQLRYDAALETASANKNAISDELAAETHAVAQRIADQIASLELMSQPIIAATIVGAFALGAFVLLCLRRDEMIDRGDDIRTTATRAGRGFVGFLLVIMLAAVAGLTIYGVDSQHAFGNLIGIAGGWWSWHLAAIACWGALLTTWASASARDDLAVGVWYLAHLALVIALTITMA